MNVEKDEEAEYECERCFKKISYEEWETYDMNLDIFEQLLSEASELYEYIENKF